MGEKYLRPTCPKNITVPFKVLQYNLVGTSNESETNIKYFKEKDNYAAVNRPEDQKYQNRKAMCTEEPSLHCQLYMTIL